VSRTPGGGRHVLPAGGASGEPPELPLHDGAGVEIMGGGETMPFTNEPWRTLESKLEAHDFCAVCLVDMSEPGREKVKAGD